MSKDKPSQQANYPYPIFSAYASQSADLIYAMTKSMIVNFDAYKDATPGAAGLELKRQLLTWVVPYHPGAIKACASAGAVLAPPVMGATAFVMAQFLGVGYA